MGGFLKKSLVVFIVCNGLARIKKASPYPALAGASTDLVCLLAAGPGLAT